MEGNAPPAGSGSSSNGGKLFPSMSQSFVPSSSSSASEQTTHTFPFDGPVPGLALRGGRSRGGTSSARGVLSSVPRGKVFGNRSAVFNTADSLPSKKVLFEPSPEEVASPLTDQELSSEAQSMSVSAKGSNSSQEDGMKRQNERHSSSFSLSNALGGSHTGDDDRKRRFENLSKQNRFFEMRSQREALRAKYIREGTLPDPEKPTDLAEAKTLTGTCKEMCPEFEREEREFQNEGDALEMFPGTGRIDPNLAVKIYRRPAAGRELPLPEDVRPPEVLRTTLDYLLHDLLPSTPESAIFTAVQPFMWNRTRAIRQDFVVQGERGPLAIECHERIARYHILCLHWRGGIGAEGWSEQQELEQLRKTIRSLTEFYEDMRQTQVMFSPNEAEFRAYNLLLHLQDPETLREVEALPSEVFDSNAVQTALKLRSYAQRSNKPARRGIPRNTEATMNLWTRFFGELRRNTHVTYLMACLAENAFSQVRAGALKAMARTYLSQHAPIPLDYLQRSLGLDTQEEARSLALTMGAEEVYNADGELQGVRLGKVNDEKPLPSAPFNRSIVEAKRGTKTCQAVLDGEAAQAAPLIPISRQRAPDPSMSKLSLPVNLRSLPLSPTPREFSTMGRDGQIAPLTLPQSLSAAAPAFVPSTTLTSQTSEGHVSPAYNKTGVSRRASQPRLATLPIEPLFPLISPSPDNIPSASTPLGQPGPERAAMPQRASVCNKSSAPASKVSDGSSLSSSLSNLPGRLVQQVPIQSLSPGESLPALMALEAPSQHRQIASPPLHKKRSVHSVTRGLYAQVVRDFVGWKVHSVGEQACLREGRLRQEDVRERLVTECAQRLTYLAFESEVDDQVNSCASSAAANRQYARVMVTAMWSRWRKALGKARELEQHDARLRHLRLTLQTRILTTPKDPVDRPKIAGRRRVSMDLNDVALQSALVLARETRQDMWAPSTFFWALAIKAEPIMIPGIDQWSAALSIASPPQEDAPTSEWLRVKFSVDRNPHAEIVLRSDACVHMVDLQSCSAADLGDERDVGLVVFELDVRLTVTSGEQAPADKALWRQQRDRLESLAAHDMIRQSRFLPKLLLVCWSAAGNGLESKLWRRSVDELLDLGNAAKARHSWSQWQLWAAAQADVPPQRGFEEQLGTLLHPLEWNARRDHVSFDDLQSSCSAEWHAMLERVEACMARLSTALRDKRSVPRKSTEVDGAAVLHMVKSAFSAATLLTKRVLDDIVSLSELVADENLDRCLVDGLLTFDEASDAPNYFVAQSFGTPAEAAYSLAFAQLQRAIDCGRDRGSGAGARDESEVLLARSKLLEQSVRSDARSFPWCEYFGWILQIALGDVQATWMESTFPNVQEIERQINSSVLLYQQAAREIEWTSHRLFRDNLEGSALSNPAADAIGAIKTTNGKRRTYIDLTDDEEKGGKEGNTSFDDEHNRPSTKFRRVENLPISISLSDERKPRNPTQVQTKAVARDAVHPSPSLASLRSLLDSANSLLSQSSA